MFVTFNLFFIISSLCSPNQIPKDFTFFIFLMFPSPFRATPESHTFQSICSPIMLRLHLLRGLRHSPCGNFENCTWNDAARRHLNSGLSREILRGVFTIRGQCSYHRCHRHPLQGGSGGMLPWEFWELNIKWCSFVTQTEAMRVGLKWMLLAGMTGVSCTVILDACK